jgi:hypothetical protein
MHTVLTCRALPNTDEHMSCWLNNIRTNIDTQLCLPQNQTFVTCMALSERSERHLCSSVASVCQLRIVRVNLKHCRCCLWQLLFCTYTTQVLLVHVLLTHSFLLTAGEQPHKREYKHDTTSGCRCPNMLCQCSFTLNTCVPESILHFDLYIYTSHLVTMRMY